MYKFLWKSRTVLLGTAGMLGGVLLIIGGKVTEGISALMLGMSTIQGRHTLEKKVDDLNSRIGKE